MAGMKAFFLLLIFSFSLAQAEEQQPLWELGVLGGGVETSDYPGSDESEFRWIVFPNFRYRGKIFRSDEKDGTRARLLDGPVYNLDFSFDFNFPVDSSENRARQGMQDIDLVFEIGPRAKIRLIHFPDVKGSFYFLVPIRKAATVDFWSLGDAGWSISPGFQYSQFGVLCPKCLMFFRVNASFFDKKNSDTFYGVSQADVTATRPAFEGKAGYNSVEIFMGYVLRIKKVQGFLGIIHNHFGGSVNADSPLLVSDNNTTVILGVGWLFWQSERAGYD